VIRFEPNDMTGAHDGASAGAAARPSPTPVAVAIKTGKHARECKAAADCIVEPEDCCDCANGGRQHAIPKAQQAASKAARAKRCKGVMCTLMLSLDPTCGKRPDCVEGQCVMVDKKPGTK
jgi:hypothetical protein